MTKVLIIEDDSFLRELVVKKLSGEGFEVIEGVDGEDGLKKAQEEEGIDIVLLDIILPGMQGFEVLEQIKSDPKTANLPVIILSNLGQKEDIEKGMKLGAVDFMIKAHFTPSEIITKIKGLIKT